MSLHKRLNIKRVIGNLTEIELLIESACDELEVHSANAYFITLAISELACNIIRHSKYDRGDEDNIDIKMYCVEDRIKVVVQDNCTPLSEAVVCRLVGGDGSVSQYDTTIENIPEHGWGLDLITHATSSISYARTDTQNVYELVFENRH